MLKGQYGGVVVGKQKFMICGMIQAYVDDLTTKVTRVIRKVEKENIKFLKINMILKHFFLFNRER